MCIEDIWEGWHISNNSSLSYITSFISHGDIPWCADTLSPLPEEPQVASERTPAETLPVQSAANNRPIPTLISRLLSPFKSLSSFGTPKHFQTPKGKLLQLGQFPVNILHVISQHNLWGLSKFLVLLLSKVLHT